MSSRVIDLFVEDRAHEAFLGPLVRRLAAEEGARVDLRVRSARGGHGRALEEYRAYQDLVERRATPDPTPDLIVVGLDGNCLTFTRKRQEVLSATRGVFRERLVTACPDPHVERWFLADPDSFYRVVGHRPEEGRQKCQRDHYKQRLQAAIRAAGHPPTLGGLEFAEELVRAMDLFRAGKRDGSLKAFVDDLRARLRLLGGSSIG